MVRTSLYLPPALRYRLQLASQQKRKSVSALVVELIDKALAAREKARLDRMYAELDKLDEITVKGVMLATIDETLYGDGPHAAWRGNGARDD
jgi:hypothetical protein